MTRRRSLRRLSSRQLTLASALVATALLGASAAQAFVPGEAKWAQLPVRYQVDTASSRELGVQGTLNVIAASYQSWVAPACSGFSAMFVREVTGGRQNANDQINTHVWLYNSWPAELGGSSVIGVTSSVWSGRGLIDADIQYNGVDHSWTTNPTNRGQVDAQSVITHEIGHQLGLNHSNDTSATMYFAYPGGTSQRSLAQDDINGVCSLYPSGQGECTANNQCQTGQSCVSGACVDNVQREGSFGDPCAAATDCQDGLLCVSAAGNAFCSQQCTGGDCPAGFECQPLQQGGGACAPSSTTAGQGELGDQCSSGQDCQEGLCVGDPNTAGGLCSRSCSTTDDQITCPSPGYYCGQLASGAEACISAGIPVGGTPVGNQCAAGAECQSGLCVGDPNGPSGICSIACDLAQPECPGQQTCEALQGEQYGYCAGDIAPRAPRGEGCLADSDCETSLCGVPADGSSGGLCTDPCTSDEECQTGEICGALVRGGMGCLPGIDPPVGEDGGVTPPPSDGGIITPPPSDGGVIVPPPTDGGTIVFPPPTNGANGGGGCAVTGSTTTDTGLGALLLLALVALAPRRRR